MRAPSGKPSQVVASLVEPPSISADAALALGIVATVLLVASVVALLVASRRRAFDPGWWSVLLPLMGAGVIAGFSGRVITAGVIGANIGGGLVILFGVPIVLALIGWAGVRAGSLTRRRDSEPVGS